MNEEQKLLSGLLYCPGDPGLKALKRKAHTLSQKYSATFEEETETREAILRELFASFGEGGFIQGPMYIHYGSHTRIGKRFFGNFNLTIQDDTYVEIGDDCNFGPNVTIVTPIHPYLPDERRNIRNKEGEPIHVCYAKPVRIGNDCWLGANVVVCPGVTIGNNCVIGAGSVVTKDIPDNTIAVGNPCRPLRTLGERDGLKNKAELFGDYML